MLQDHSRGRAGGTHGSGTVGPVPGGAAAVLLSPEPDLHGLSRHDLDVLGLIVAGWEDDERIAAALRSTTEDVADTARRGMQLLGTTSRTGLAVRALREGLFVPRRASGEAG
jgi:DNA-binding NarL/FixJ family response regulator